MDHPREHNAHPCVVCVDAPVQRVWQALTDASTMSKWLASDCQIEARQDGKLRLAWDDGGAFEGLIESFEPMRSLRVRGTYRSQQHDTGMTLDFQLVDEGEISTLNIVEKCEMPFDSEDQKSRINWSSATLRLQSWADPEQLPPGSVDAIERGLASLRLGARLQNKARREPSMELEEYRAALRDTSPPTDAQIEDYVGYVAGAHSWYKHLPFWYPGVPFCFYFNPFVAHDTGVGEDGRLLVAARGVDSDAESGERPPLVWSHYAWLSTEEHHRRFAYLDYTAASLEPLFCTGERFVRVPDAVIEAGHTDLTAVVHDHFFDMLAPMFKRIVELAGDDAQWAPQTGGNDTVRRLLAFRDGLEKARRWTEDERSEVESLIRPEMMRQRKAMAAAMRRARNLVYSS